MISILLHFIKRIFCQYTTYMKYSKMHGVTYNITRNINPLAMEMDI